jgi:hypothetical protein
MWLKQETYQYRLEPKSLASMKAIVQARKAPGQRQFGGRLFGCSEPKPHLTKVLTGITEDYCYKKTKALVLLSPALGNLRLGPSGHCIARRQKSNPRGRGLGLSRWAWITKQKIVVSYNILAQLSPLEGHPSVLDYRAFQKIATIVG